MFGNTHCDKPITFSVEMLAQRAISERTTGVLNSTGRDSVAVPEVLPLSAFLEPAGVPGRDH
jgi:hypothetical protein